MVNSQDQSGNTSFKVEEKHYDDKEDDYFIRGADDQLLVMVRVYLEGFYSLTSYSSISMKDFFAKVEELLQKFEASTKKNDRAKMTLEFLHHDKRDLPCNTGATRPIDLQQVEDNLGGHFPWLRLYTPYGWFNFLSRGEEGPPEVDIVTHMNLPEEIVEFWKAVVVGLTLPEEALREILVANGDLTEKRRREKVSAS